MWLNWFAIDDNKQAANTEPEASAIHDGEYQLTKNEFSSCLLYTSDAADE